MGIIRERRSSASIRRARPSTWRRTEATPTTRRSVRSRRPTACSASTATATAMCTWPFGADGITHDKHNVYITNFDYGRIVRFPIKRDGTAGTPVTVVQSCAYQGAKGIAVDKHGSLLFNSQLNNRVCPTFYTWCFSLG